MSVSETVTTQDGVQKTVIAENETELRAAVKQAKADKAPVYPNINHPVQKGHDLVAVDEDVNKVLVDGEGAHNSPYNAVDDSGDESGDPDVTAAGLEEPAYKSVPVNSGVAEKSPVPTKAEVAAAQKDSEPANEVEPKAASKK